MPPLSNLLLFAAAALALLLVPGPAVFYITARSAAQGVRAGAVSVLGIHTGTLVHVAASVAGVSALVAASSVAFSALKLAGAAYLIVVGIRRLRAQRGVTDVDAAHDAEPSPAPPAARSLRRLYVDGFVVNVLNPKTALFFLAFLPQFTAAGSGPVWVQTAVLGVLFTVLGFLSDSAYAVTAAVVADRLRRRRAVHPTGRVARAGRYLEGGTLVGLGVTAALAPRRS